MMRTVIALTALAVSACSAAAVGNCSHSLPNNQVCPDGHGPFFYEDPDHCSMYWQCDEGCASHMLCQGDYLYDDVHQWCNFPQQVSCGERDCDGRPCKPNPPPINFTCPEPSGIFPDPDNCIKYYQCYEGAPEQKTCDVRTGQQLLYDPGHQWCDWPDRVSCGARPICDQNDDNCTNQPTHAPTTTRQPNTCDTFGECYHAGEMRSEGDCKQCFCECAGTGDGNAWQQICCQPGLVFNPTSGQCDWPYNTPNCH